MVVVVMAQGLQIFYIWSKFAKRGSYFFSSLLFCHLMSILSSSSFFFDIYVLLGKFKTKLSVFNLWVGPSTSRFCMSVCPSKKLSKNVKTRQKGSKHVSKVSKHVKKDDLFSVMTVLPC